MEYTDSDIALRRGLGYLHACDDSDVRCLPATSTALVDRPASDPSSTSAAVRGFWSDNDNDKTVEMIRPDVENVQPHYDETPRLTSSSRCCRLFGSETHDPRFLSRTACWTVLT